MDEQQQIQNLEVRVRRLEQLHIWGISAVFLVGIAYLVTKTKK
jgi:hypothetical protein